MGLKEWCSMEDLANIYLIELENKEEFKRLLFLKKEIEKKYSNLIIAMKTKEAIYLEAKDKKDHYDLEKAKKEFSIAKVNLYSKEEVKEYFMLENKINRMLDEDFNDIKKSISNKFKKRYIIDLN